VVTVTGDERLRRWRLVLGGESADGTGVRLGPTDLRLDAALRALYDPDRSGGLGSSAPSVARWLGDIRAYFPAPVVQVLQRDAIDRLGLHRMLLEPETLAAVEPDVHLVADLIALRGLLPETTRDTARMVVRRVVEDLERRLAQPLRQAVTGSLHRAARTRRPRAGEIDWDRTIRANLRHYQPAYRTVVPETLVGYGHRRSSLRHVVVCVDQSGSMATSVVHAGVLAAVLASLPSLRTRLVVFDTAVVDLTDQLADPVDVLFGTQLGGGTDINRALAYCQQVVERPTDTILVLISDLYEGGDRDAVLARTAALVRAGVQVVVLLALNDDGAPSFDHALAADLADLGVPAFACTPDAFPDLMAAALDRDDLGRWAADRGISTVRAPDA
jgi:Mg-chelatase subunit ChlD